MPNALPDQAKRNPTRYNIDAICQHMGVDIASSKQELQGFAGATDVHKLASELEDKLPGQ
jgi:hypothetical protein